MTLGIAASSSTRIATGRLTTRGASSVRYSAIATASGVAITIAMRELTSVP